jgi:cytochrome c1
VLDPQHVKPGVRMPALPLPREEQRDLFAFLESLE